MRFTTPTTHYKKSEDAQKTACGLLTQAHPDYAKTGTRSATISTTKSHYGCTHCWNKIQKEKGK